MPPTQDSWTSDTVYVLIRVSDLKLWSRRGWVDSLAEAHTYLTWEATDKAKDRNPLLEGTVPMAVSLRVDPDSYRRVCDERARFSVVRQKPLF